jgi:hypothetical protein
MLVRVWLFAVLLASPLSAQTVSPGLEHANPEMAGEAVQLEVRQRVEEFLMKLGTRDVAAVRTMLAPKAFVAIAREKDGAYTNTYQTGEEFLATFEKSAAQPRFEEPLTNVRVTIDSGALAYVRADFKVVRDGKVLSSGVDHFTLLKEPDGWKIAVIAYTTNPVK